MNCQTGCTVTATGDMELARTQGTQHSHVKRCILAQGCIYIFTSHPIVNLSTIPLLDDVFFQKRLDELIKHIFATTGLAIKWHCYTIEFQGRAPSHVTSKSNLYSV